MVDIDIAYCTGSRYSQRCSWMKSVVQDLNEFVILFVIASIQSSIGKFSVTFN